MKKLLLMVAAFALLVAACGGGEASTGDATLNADAQTGDQLNVDTDELPVASADDLPLNADGEPAADSTCLAGEPDCDDIPGADTPQDLPLNAGGDTVPVVAVADAVGTSGQVVVQGFIVESNGEIHLCSALAESFPPQCGGESITVTDQSQVDPDSLQTEGDVTWTNEQVLISGEMVDGTLVANTIN